VPFTVIASGKVLHEFWMIEGRILDAGQLTDIGRGLSVHVVVGADVDERHAVGRQDEHDAVLAREARRESFRERAIEAMRVERWSVGIFSNRHDGGFNGA
jgi:hypothetical protein